MEETFECSGFWEIELDVESRQRMRIWHFIILLSLQLKNCYRYMLLLDKISTKDTFSLNFRQTSPLAILILVHQHIYCLCAIHSSKLFTFTSSH